MTFEAFKKGVTLGFNYGQQMATLYEGDIKVMYEQAFPQNREFDNQSSNKFTDISSEQYREYIFPNGDKVRVDQPLQLSVSTSGHRLFDAAGVSHYIPKGWIQLSWKAKDGQPHFVK